MTKQDNDFTVLSDWTNADQQSHREIAQELLPKIKEELPEERYKVDFTADLQSAVIGSIARDLNSNLGMEDWYGMGFEDAEDFLDADEVSDRIGEIAKRYFEDDQVGKSWDILKVILEYAEECGLVERREGSQAGDRDE